MLILDAPKLTDPSKESLLVPSNSKNQILTSKLLELKEDNKVLEVLAIGVQLDSKLDVCEDIFNKLKEFKQTIAEIQQLNKDMDEKLLARATEIEENEKLMQEKLIKITKLNKALEETRNNLNAEVKLKEDALKSLANKEILISNKDIELQHVQNQLNKEKEKMKAVVGMEELIKSQGNEIDALKSKS